MKETETVRNVLSSNDALVLYEKIERYLLRLTFGFSCLLAGMIISCKDLMRMDHYGYFPEPAKYVFLGVGLLLLGFAWLGRKRFLMLLDQKYPLTRRGYDYIQSIARSFRPTKILPKTVLACIISAVVNLVTVSDIRLIPVLLTAVFPLMLMLHCVLMRHTLSCLKLEIAAESEWFSGEEKRWKRILRGILHTLILLILPVGLYIGLCIWSGSLLVFSYIPLLGLSLYLMDLFIFNPFAEFGGLRRRQIGVRLFRVLAVIMVIMVTSFTMTNSTWLHTRYITSVQKVDTAPKTVDYDKDSGIYTLKYQTDEFKILQLTDIHLGGTITTYKSDQKALRCCEELIRRTAPDLVVVTGDLLFALPLSVFSFTTESALAQFCVMMEQLEVPWVFVYGNHDSEKFSLMPAQKINETLLLFSYSEQAYYLHGSGAIQTRPRGNLNSSVMPSITGRYNQVIRVVNSEPQNEWMLYLLDSNAYVSDQAVNSSKYDNIHEDQIAWYEKSVKANPGIPSLMFYHIPIEEYRMAYEEALFKNPEAVLLFGQKGETASCPAEENRLFETALALGSTKAMFCGHDHLNNYAVRYHGIDLVYGMSVDYLAYPNIAQRTAQRGATLITIKGQDYAIQQIPYGK